MKEGAGGNIHSVQSGKDEVEVHPSTKIVPSCAGQDHLTSRTVTPSWHRRLGQFSVMDLKDDLTHSAESGITNRPCESQSMNEK